MANNKAKPSFDPPFPVEKRLDSTPLTQGVIPGEFIPLSKSSAFLNQSLAQPKAEKISRHLWFAGPPGRFRTLHQQHALRRTIIPCEEPALHLIWHANIIWIKPLSPSLTNYEFFEEYVCQSPELYYLACGYLYSYTHLIRYYSDYRIAKEKGLLRDDISWQAWQSFRLSLDSFFEQHPEYIHTRYHYGDLRLSRLNFVHRLGNFRGYHNVYTHYGPYFSTYFASAIVIFAFASVTLTAMQVALTVPPSDIPMYLAITSYRFSIAIIVAVAVIVISLTLIFIPIVALDFKKGFLANLKLAHKLRQHKCRMTAEEA